MREIRCFPENRGRASATGNTWSGMPARPTADRFWCLRAVVEGPVDEKTGYLCDIRELDALLREVVMPILDEHELRGPGGALRRALASARLDAPEGAPLRSLEWAVSPYLRFSIHQEQPDMVRVTQSFEFAAAHRLALNDLSDEENRQLFGKCSNPHGHGHNYILEVSVNVSSGDSSPTTLPLAELNRVVQKHVIEPLDHRNLNSECAEFAHMNPTVENIARVIWQRLEHQVPFGALASVKVWETPKTWAEYTDSR